MPTQARALPGIMKASTQQGSVVVPGQVGGEKMSYVGRHKHSLKIQDNGLFLGAPDNCHVGRCPNARTEADAGRAHLPPHPGFSS